MYTSYRFLHVSRILPVIFMAFVLFGCAPSQVRHKTDHHETEESVSVLLMPVDIELSALTTGGVKEVRADWTETAKGLVQRRCKLLVSRQ